MPTSYKRYESRLPKKFSTATNPRFKHHLSHKNDFSAYKDALIDKYETLSKSSDTTPQQKLAFQKAIREIYASSDIEEIAKATKNTPSVMRDDFKQYNDFSAYKDALIDKYKTLSKSSDTTPQQKLAFQKAIREIYASSDIEEIAKATKNTPSVMRDDFKQYKGSREENDLWNYKVQAANNLIKKIDSNREEHNKDKSKPFQPIPELEGANINKIFDQIKSAKSLAEVEKYLPRKNLKKEAIEKFSSAWKGRREETYEDLVSKQARAAQDLLDKQNRGVPSRQELQKGHEAKQFEDAYNPDREAQKAQKEKVKEIVKEEKPLKNYITKFPDFTNVPELVATHGTPAEQQFRHGILNKTLDEISKPYKPYEGERFAQRDPLEQLALDNIQKTSPFTNENILEHHKDIKNRIHKLSGLKKPSEAASPYLSKANQNPLDIFKGKLDQDVLEKIGRVNEDLDRKFNEEYLPKIERMNMVGPAKYGAASKALERAIRDHERNKGRLVQDMLSENNKMSLEAGQRYIGHHANVAQIAAQHAGKERSDEENMAHFLAQHHQNEENEKEKYIQHLKNEGSVNRAREQQVLDETYNEFNRAKEHEYQGLVKGMDITSKMPQRPSEYQTRAATQPPIDRPNFNQQFGGGLFNMGANRFANQFQPQPHKKGGLVKNKKADGGLIGEAVQNAVIERSDPLYELKRLFNRNNAMDISQTKIGKRRKYNSGGLVNPIQAGAQQALEFKEKEHLKKYLKGRENPEPRSAASDMLNDFMVGVSHVGGDNFLGRAANAYKESAQNRELAKSKSEENRFKSLMAQYDIEKEARTEERKSKKEMRDEAYREKLLKLKSDFYNSKAPSKLKLDKTDNEILTTVNKSLLKAPDLIEDLNTLEKLSENIGTGGISSRIPGVNSPYIQGIINKGSQAEYDQFDTLANKIALEASLVFGSKAGASIAKMFKEAKPHRGMSNEAIKESISNMKNHLQNEIKKAQFINDSYENGIAPTKALNSYSKQTNEPEEKVESGLTTQVPESEKADSKFLEFENQDPELQELEALYANL